MATGSQSRTARRKQRKKKRRPILKTLAILIGLFLLVSGLGVGGVFAYYVSGAPSIDSALLSDPASTKVYDKDGEMFADLGTEKRTKISYNDLPQVLIDAVIATEDARFFEHVGIDFKRIGGAVLANITDGFGSEGASTITQQVVKGSFLSPDKTVKRKVQEQWLAIQLDSRYSKKGILEMYLNKIYYGAGAYGVAKAAETYFGKTDLNELTLSEAALLAGLPQRPTGYNPFVNPELATERMNTVLNLMVLHGKITEQEANEARQVTVASMLTDSRSDSTPYEAFLQKVADEVKEKLDIDIYNEGLEIYTTLDQNAQKQVEFLLTDSESNPISYPDEDFQAGLTVLDTKTGAIRAIGGGRNRENNNGWNYAYQGNGRQPGSTIKPITVYGPAIEKNQWSTYHQINDDSPYDVAGSTPIQNWNRQYQGWMSMRYALQWSLNVPAAKVLNEVGYDTAQPFAESLGIQFADNRMTIRDAIGGTATGLTPMQLAGAYRAFGNEGIYNEPFAVTKVEYSDGRTVDLTPEPKPVMSDYTAYMITDMLKTVVTSGTGTTANVSGLPIAGKTGTTNLANKEGSPDSWFSGYTTNYTIAVWTGYDDQKRVLPNTKIAQQLFRFTMEEISKGIETPDFTRPSSVKLVSVEKGTNPAKLPSEYTPNSEIVKELFVEGNVPTQVSKRYDQIEPVEQLEAEYNEERNVIQVQWKYEEDTSRPVSFAVSAGTGNNLTQLTTTKEMQLEISNVDRDTEYKIQVIVISDENEENVSEPSTITITIPEEELDEDEENDDNKKEDKEDKKNGNGNKEPSETEDDSLNDEDLNNTEPEENNDTNTDNSEQDETNDGPGSIIDGLNENNDNPNNASLNRLIA